MLTKTLFDPNTFNLVCKNTLGMSNIQRTKKKVFIISCGAHCKKLFKIISLLMQISSLRGIDSKKYLKYKNVDQKLQQTRLISIVSKPIKIVALVVVIVVVVFPLNIGFNIGVQY